MLERTPREESNNAMRGSVGLGIWGLGKVLVGRNKKEQVIRRDERNRVEVKD